MWVGGLYFTRSHIPTILYSPCQVFTARNFEKNKHHACPTPPSRRLRKERWRTHPLPTLLPHRYAPEGSLNLFRGALGKDILTAGSAAATKRLCNCPLAGIQIHPSFPASANQNTETESSQPKGAEEHAHERTRFVPRPIGRTVTLSRQRITGCSWSPPLRLQPVPSGVT